MSRFYSIEVLHHFSWLNRRRSFRLLLTRLWRLNRWLIRITNNLLHSLDLTQLKRVIFLLFAKPDCFLWLLRRRSFNRYFQDTWSRLRTLITRFKLILSLFQIKRVPNCASLLFADVHINIIVVGDVGASTLIRTHWHTWVASKFCRSCYFHYWFELRC